MSNITHIVRAEINLSNPVPDICNAISAVIQAYPGREKELLMKLKGEIQHTIDHLEKEAKSDGKQVR